MCCCASLTHQQICEYIPKRYLEATYGILLPKPKVEEGEDPDRLPTAYELMTAYSCELNCFFFTAKILLQSCNSRN